MANNPQTHGIRAVDKIGYALGDLGGILTFSLVSSFLTMFYTDILGISTASITVLMLIARIWDAVNDPMWGAFIDSRKPTRYGRFRPYIFGASIPLAIGAFLMFLKIPGLSTTQYLIFAYVTYLIMMTVYTAINVPYGAMLGVMTPDSRERTVFSSYRMFFAYGGSFLALAIFEPLRNLFAGLGPGVTQADAWQYSMMVIGLICAILFILCFSMTRERVKDVLPENGKSPILKDLKSLVSNGPWWILLGAATGTLLFNSIRGGAAAYYFKDVIGNQAIFSCGIYLAVGEIANMIGVAAAVPFADRLGKKTAFITALLSAAILSLFIAFLPVSEPSWLWVLLLLQIIISLAAGITLPLLWSMFADIADYSAYRNSSASTGLIFSSSSMSQKFGGAFGSALILWVFAGFGYDTSEGAVQSATAIDGLKAMMSWIPALGAIAAAGILALYPLTSKRMQEISASLRNKTA